MTQNFIQNEIGSLDLGAKISAALLSDLMKLRMTCPFKDCRVAMSYAEFYRGFDSIEDHRHGNCNAQVGLDGLGSWPLPDSHLKVCEHQPVSCDKCEAKL